MTAEITVRRFGVASPATATVLSCLVLALAVAYVLLASLVHQLAVGDVAEPAVIVIFAAVGLVVARRQPRNPVGWILLVFSLLFMFSADAGYYAVLSYHLGHRLPLAAAAVLLEPLWVPAVALFPLVILLFPDGRLMSRRWRWVLWAYAGLAGYFMTVVWVPTIAAVASHDVRLDSLGDVTNAGQPSGGAATAAAVLVLVLIGGTWLSFVASQVLSWRRAAGERRQQLKWLAGGAAITVVSFVLSIPFGAGILGLFVGIGIAAMPVSIGVGILKYRLYDIDRIISRTVAYAIVTGLLVGVYAGLVLLTTQVFRVHTPVAVAAATLAAAALFNPLRRRVQHVVDRRFNRARYDAGQTVAAFAARLKDAVDLDSVRGDLASVVHQALEPVHVSVWISERR